jgi:hypothetical protein
VPEAVALMDLLQDKAFLMKLFLIGFWGGIVMMVIGFAIIIKDLLG